MPGASDIAIGNEKFDVMVYQGTVAFPTLGANASSTTSVTMGGVLPLDLISWNMQNPPAHLTIDNIYVSSANTLAIQWGTDATGIANSTVAVMFSAVRGSNAPLGTAGFPGAIV